jgi:SRSO17 transposase
MMQKHSQTYCEEIEKSRGKRFEDKFISWLSRKVEVKNYRAKIKFAPEMRI